jgi:hypothetical protein
MTMDHDSHRIGPGIYELPDGLRVILGEENIRWLPPFDDIGEAQSQHRGKVAGERRRIRVRVRYGNADFPLARLVTLGVVPRKYDKLRISFLSSRHRYTTLPPLRRDGQVAHDYI